MIQQLRTDPDPQPNSAHDQNWEIKFKNCEIKVRKSKTIFHNNDSFLQREYEFMCLKLNHYRKKLIKRNFCIIFANALME